MSALGFTLLEIPEGYLGVVIFSRAENGDLDVVFREVKEVVPAPRSQYIRALRKLADVMESSIPG